MPEGLVVFDLDGTLLRGPTVCELFSVPLGRLEEMQRFEHLTSELEIAEARAKMARWYEVTPRERLLECLRTPQLAPDAELGIAYLRDAGVEIAIASVTWDFAVEHIAQRLRVIHFIGTRIERGGEIKHVWPRDKAEWLTQLALTLGVARDRTAAVGDSLGDVPMLQSAGLGFFVGSQMPAILNCIHMPARNILKIAQEILAAWKKM